MLASRASLAWALLLGSLALVGCTTPPGAPPATSATPPPSCGAVAPPSPAASGAAASPAAAPAASAPSSSASSANAAKVWQGRLGLTVLTDPPTQYHAGFTLKGTGEAGELALTTPWGNQLALVKWQPERVTLDYEGKRYVLRSLADLTQRLSGAALPVAELLDALNGGEPVVDGWLLRRESPTRLFWLRQQPLPRAELRVVLEDTP